jgi:hypothetical protein
MSTKPAFATKPHPENSIETKTYNLVESLKEFMPIENDRYRLGYGLFKYLNGEGDAPEVLLQSAKIRFEGIEYSDLAKKLSDGLRGIK